MGTSQLRLLHHSCGLSLVSEAAAPTDGDDGLGRAASLITQGAFLDAVRTVPALGSLLDCSTDADAVHDAASYYELVGRRATAAVEAAISAAGPDATAKAAAKFEAVLVAGVASLHIFGQHSLTGPTYGGPPPSPLDLFAPPAVAQLLAEAPPRPRATVAAAVIAEITGESTAAAAGSDAAAAAEFSTVAGLGAETALAAAAASDGLAGLGVDSLSRGDLWAREQLQLDGEDLVGRCTAVQWLLLARVLLLGPLGVDVTASTTASTTSAVQRRAQEQEQEAAAQPPSAAPPAPTPSASFASSPLSRLPALLRSPAAAAALGDPGTAVATAADPAPLPWSWCWWSLRCVMSHQHVLEGRAHSLLREASRLIGALTATDCPWAHPPTAAAAGPAAYHSSAATEPPPPHQAPAPASSSPLGAAAPPQHQSVAAALGGVLHVELALCQYLYGYVEGGRQYLARAGQLLGLEPQLTGAMGKRTVHQIDPKAQLVVVASSTARSVPPGSDLMDQPVEELGLTGLTPASQQQPTANRELEGLSSDSDVLPAPVLVGEDGRTLADSRYSAPEQALLLAWATAVKKGTSADDLQDWQMAPWVEAVLAQPRGVFMTAAAARLSKTRHERSRGRTRERALLTMDQLAEAITAAPPPPPPEPTTAVEAEPTAGASSAAAAADPAAAETPSSSPSSVAAAASDAVATSGWRAVLSWAVWFPPQVVLRREAAEHYVSMGLVGAAIRVFESLELWDSALTCYRLVGKKALAEELVRRRLGVTPDDPRLWCALGDLHLDDRYYEEAWRRSGQRHTRSQRSLARSAMRRKDYAKASAHWESALALNPLHPEAWFSLGFCLLRQDRHRAALRAFTRVTQQEPENGEAWNNIAALWMHLGGYRPAYAALSESVRHKRDSWQTWENFARAALASGHYQQSVRGLQRSLRLSSGQRLFVDVVSGLLDVLEGRPPPRDGGTSLAAAAAAAAEGLRGVAGAADAETDASLQEDEAALGVPLLPLLADLQLRPPGEDGEEGEEEARADAAQTAGTAASPSSAVEPASADLLSGREREVVLGGVGSLLREAVNCPVAGPALWGCLARYWGLRGEADSAKEARLKQVRGLAGGAFKSDPARFLEYGEASEALSRCYLEAFRQGRPGGLKDLAAGRMHLRGLLRATAENFANHPLTTRLQALLEEITAAEDEALAASRATTAAVNS